MTIVAGLDVGGAHLKVSLVADGQPIAARQFVCPLWQGLDKLDTALQDARELTSRASSFAVTMTGELSDLFETRKQGVETLVDRLVAAFGPETRFWMGHKLFGSADAARLNYPDVSSTNFLATATLAGRRLRANGTSPNALLIDIGSTSTDIIPIIEARAAPRGLTDPDRLVSGELVYTGLTRTAVMAVCTRAPFAGTWQNFAREYLATMADVRRILGVLPDGLDVHATADDRGKSQDESLARFARMFCREAGDASIATWQQAARYVAELQIRSIHDGCAQVLSGIETDEHPETVVATGLDTTVGREIAHRLGLPSTTFSRLAGAPAELAAAVDCNAPAVAVALLLE